MNYGRIAIAGLVATAAMTAIMFLLPLFGLPKMTVATVFMAMAGGHEILGWIIHFIIGIIFAFIYVKFINEILPVISDVGRGAIYSIVIFVLSAAVMWYLTSIGQFGDNTYETMSLSLFTNVIGYLVYGAVLGSFFKRKAPVIFPEHQKGPHPSQ